MAKGTDSCNNNTTTRMLNQPTIH